MLRDGLIGGPSGGGGGGGSTSTDLELGGSDELDGNKVSASLATLSGTTPTPDANTNGLAWQWTLSGTSTLGDPTNVDAGMTFVLKVKQPGAGGPHGVTWPSSFQWPGGAAPTLSVGINAVDIVTGFYDGTDWFCSYSLDVR